MNQYIYDKEELTPSRAFKSVSRYFRVSLRFVKVRSVAWESPIRVDNGLDAVSYLKNLSSVRLPVSMADK